MPTPTRDGQSEVYDLLGVGFGPSNLALAIAVREHNEHSPAAPLRTRFLERQPRFGWHRGMLISDATMQVSFLKDLVTMRDPTSAFSFLNYLYARGRLVDFINHKNLFPLRSEFHDYFEWAAGQLDEMVSYSSEVVEIHPVVRDGELAYFDVVSRGGDGVREVLRARNLVVGTGLRPHLPEGAVTDERVWHNSELLHRVDGLADSLDGAAGRFVVVGAGQSAAEVTAYLHERFPESEVCGVFARYGYTPSDDSSFANRIFDPDAVEEYYRAPEHVKQRLMDYHGNTNYSAVDLDLIDELYRRVYREKVHATQRLRLFHASRIADARRTDSGVRTTVESLTTGERTTLDADVLVYSTGYRPADPTPLLGELAGYCLRDDESRLCLERDYRIRLAPEPPGGVYLQGGSEHTHGITSSLLSNTAVRVEEILRSVLRRRQAAVSIPAQSGHAVGATQPR